MRVIVAGSREITDYGIVQDALAWFEEYHGTVSHVISGGARGVDRLGERWGREHGVPRVQFLAEWDKYGKSAGYKRNVVMAENADALVAVWDGQSRGTKHMIDIARKHGLVVLVWKPKEA